LQHNEIPVDADDSSSGRFPDPPQPSRWTRLGGVVRDVTIYWYPEAPPDAAVWEQAIRRDFGCVFVALDRHGALWRVAQAHIGDGEDLRESVGWVLKEAGLPVE
jgi:hypothetical protein